MVKVAESLLNHYVNFMDLTFLNKYFVLQLAMAMTSQINQTQGFCAHMVISFCNIVLVLVKIEQILFY